MKNIKNYLKILKNGIDTLDISKLKDLGWYSKIELDHGLKVTYEQYKKELKEKTLRVK